MSNKINLNWDGASDDNYIVGYQIQWRLNTNSAWSNIISLNHDPNYLSNTSKSGGGYYTHIISRLSDHIFRIRTIDSIGQYSGYKEISVSVDTSQVLISNYSTNKTPLACSLHESNPVNPIILTTSNIVPFVTYIKNSDNSTFNGNNEYWRVLFNGINYSCKVDILGKVLSIDTCSSISIKTEFLSATSYIILNSSICSAYLETPIYYYNTLDIGTIIYKTLNDDGITLSDIFIGGDKFYLISYENSTYIVKILNDGSISSLENYISMC